MLARNHDERRCPATATTHKPKQTTPRQHARANAIANTNATDDHLRTNTSTASERPSTGSRRERRADVRRGATKRRVAPANRSKAPPEPRRVAAPQPQRSATPQKQTATLCACNPRQQEQRNRGTHRGNAAGRDRVRANASATDDPLRTNASKVSARPRTNSRSEHRVNVRREATMRRGAPAT